MRNDESASEIHLQVKKIQKEQWAKQAGRFLQAMLTSHQHAMSLLRHPSPAVRLTAIEVLMSHWKSHDDQFANICEDLIASDSNNDVRHAALLALGHCWVNSDNVRIGALLASVVENDTVPLENRQAAYMSLVIVRRGTPAVLEHATLALGFSLDDIDSTFVKESLDTSRLSVPVDPLHPYK